MAKNKWLDRLIPKKYQEYGTSWVRSVAYGSLYRVRDLQGNSSFSDIKTQIDTMRALVRDSQIDTALSYYATDATTVNSSGQVIWATPLEDKDADCAEVVNSLFKRWNVEKYARDHILELATIGNLYMPTTKMYSEVTPTARRVGVALDNNTIPEEQYDIIPSTKIPPETIVHVWDKGQPSGYIMNPDRDTDASMPEIVLLPESAVIHFSLGGLLGDYKISGVDSQGNAVEYDIQFATPLMARATQPTQTLNLLEDALLLSSLSRTIKFINVRCGGTEDEIRDALQEIKDAVEQQLALNTVTGDAQSFVNPQSPNNLIYLPYIGDSEAISITDLNMAESTEADNKLLQHYQDKKLSVLGVPKEAMNFSSNEGLGGAGSVLSQRSALYANSLQRLEVAYMAGWTDAINKYFLSRNMSGFVDRFVLHMNPIITQQSTILFDKKDSTLNQASTAVDLMKSLGVEDKDDYTEALSEILTEAFPKMGTAVADWKIDPKAGGESNAF